jgi:DNA polymerase I
MPHWDVRILTGTYTDEGDGVKVLLFGKTREGKSITIQYRGFRPYFQLVEPSDKVRNELQRELESGHEVVELRDRKLWIIDPKGGGEKQVLEIVMRHPYRVPNYRDMYGEGDNVLAADIVFKLRFMFNLDIGGCTRVHGKEEKGIYSTNIVVNAEKFEDCEPLNPDLTILSFDIENSIKDETIFTICLAVRKGGKIKRESCTGTEKEILQKFEKRLREHDPDIITGFNVDNYDIPMVIKRADKYGLKIKFGRTDKDIVQRANRWFVDGRVVADAWWNAKMQLRPKKETLAAISQLVLGESKEDVDPKKIDEEWKADSEKVISYCKKDAELALRILEKIGVLEKHLDLASVARLPLEDTINGRTSTLIDSILIREADRHNIGVPMTSRGAKSEKIEGGYVHAVDPGVYHWVITLDFKSMYPSIIISKNICFSTLDPKGGIASPVKGVRFLSKSQRKGLLPEILKKLMKDRDDTKKLAKEAKKKNDLERLKYYDGLQSAIKILMNSFYGVMASAFYRFTNNDIGASITAFARENTKNIIKALEAEGIKVIYGDTDSVFLSSPKQDLEGSVQWGNELAKRFTREDMALEFEKIMEPFFTHGVKKRYVGRVVWPTEETLVRGYEIRRTDAFDFQSESLEKIFHEILDGDVDDAVKLAKDLVQQVQLGKVPKEKLVISRTAKGTGEHGVYKNPDTMANVQTARKLIEMGYDFVPGMKVSWIVVDSRRTPQQVEPYIDGRKFEHEPDWDYYARRVAASLARVTDVFGWSEGALLSGTKQTSLFGFGTRGGKKGPGRGGKRKRKGDGKPPGSLDGFM